MSVDRSAQRLLRCYPASWRARYGEELVALIADMSDGHRLSWRLRADVAGAGAREWLLGRGVGDPRAGGRRVLWAWAIFILAGAILAKTSEHWQQALPAAGHPIASVAFAVLQVVAILTAVLVLAGIALAIPSAIAFLRAGGWPQIRRWVLAAAVLTTLLVAATIGLAHWAHTLTPQARAGHDLPYAAAFLAWAALVATSLLCWTRAATVTADRLHLSPRTLLLHARLAPAIAVAMAVMTAATIIWWTAIALVSPGALTGPPTAPHASALVPALVAAAVLMTLATGLAATGARRANTV
ncbi:MAG: hypothetical protein ACRDMJ_07430 [Solirubrobacteraceae bacterium]